MNTGGTKEATILGLSNSVRGSLQALKNDLDNAFDNQPSPEGKAEATPTCPNVLDTIIGNLTESYQQIERLHKFVEESVVKKIL